MVIWWNWTPQSRQGRSASSKHFEHYGPLSILSSMGMVIFPHRWMRVVLHTWPKGHEKKWVTMISHGHGWQPYNHNQGIYTDTFQKPWSWNIVWRGLRSRHNVFMKIKNLKRKCAKKSLRILQVHFFSRLFFM